MGNGVDTLFCNADEATAWAKTDRIDIAINELKDIAKELYVTLGSQGAEVCSLEGRWQVGGESVAVDTNGAGDMYAVPALQHGCKAPKPLTQHALPIVRLHALSRSLGHACQALQIINCYVPPNDCPHYGAKPSWRLMRISLVSVTQPTA